MTGVGGGTNRADAEFQALAALAQSFEVEITVDSTTRERYRQIATETGVIDESELEIVQNVDVRTNMQLLNARIAEIATGRSGRYYAIAVLERGPTAELYRSVVRRNEAQIANLLADADVSSSALMRYSLLGVASVLARTNADLLNQLLVIDTGSDSRFIPNVSEDQVLRRAADSASDLRTWVRFGDTDSNRFFQVIAQELSARQFPIVSDDYRMIVDGDVDMHSFQASDRLSTVEWALRINVVDETGTVVLAFQRDGRASGSSETTARAFAERAIEAALREDFPVRLQEQFDRMVYRG